MPIVLTKDEWARIVKWTDTNKEDPEAARRREYLKYLNEQSSKMTKSWPNSLENVNKRNEEVRRARIEASENANTRFYKRYVKRMREEQERLMYSARDTIFKNKDAPKLLLNGVIESVILKEREEQLKFNKEFIGTYEAEQQRIRDETTINNAKEWHQLMENRKKKRFEVNKQNQQELVKQANEIRERKRRIRENELEMQRQDIINSTKELETLKEFEENFKATEKARIWADNKRSIEETEQRRREQRARDDMDDQLLEALKRSLCRTELKRRATEKEIRAEKLRILEAISKKLAHGNADRDARELASLNKAVAERDAAVEARHKAQLDKEARHQKDRIEQREQFLRNEAQRLHEERTMQQWELMNRFKNQEIYEEFQKHLRQEKERKIKEYREDMLRLWKERDERDAAEKAETRHFYGELAKSKFRDADNKLLTHAAALIEEAERHGRPTLPIYKALNRYCKLYRLYPMPDLPDSLQKHFPHYKTWDGTSPDPEYREPPPPPPDRGPDAPDDEEEHAAGGKTDGLQALLVKKGPKSRKGVKVEEKKIEIKVQKPAEDYKRQGPANGLQRKPSQEDVVLPPIHVASCRIVECHCVK